MSRWDTTIAVKLQQGVTPDVPHCLLPQSVGNCEAALGYTLSEELFCLA